MVERTLVTGGTVWTEAGPVEADVLTEHGRIAAVGDLAGSAMSAELVDARGLDVLPGMIDLHVHLDDRIGSFELADTFASGSEVALRNGITTIAGFVTQRAGETLDAAVQRCVRHGGGRSHCDFTFHLTPTEWPWDWDAVQRAVRSGFTTFKVYTTYREAGLYTDYERLRTVMEHLLHLRARLLVHCEDDALLEEIDPAEVDLSRPFSHTLLRPEAAEAEAIRRVLALAEETGCPVHIVHVSGAASAALVEQARERCRVTCETAPHYLLLDEQALTRPHGHRLLCTPPLRPAATRERLENLLAADALDLLATDHCAFRRTDKDAWDGTDFRAVPCGVAGLGALVPLAWELLVDRHRLPLSEVMLRLAANPARVLGRGPRLGVFRGGAPPDLVVADRHGPRRGVVSTLANAYDPWSGRTTTVTMRHVLLRGRPVVRDGALIDAPHPRGALATMR
jgi:dihydropyrimidinase